MQRQRAWRAIRGDRATFWWGRRTSCKNASRCRIRGASTSKNLVRWVPMCLLLGLRSRRSITNCFLRQLSVGGLVACGAAAVPHPWLLTLFSRGGTSCAGARRAAASERPSGRGSESRRLRARSPPRCQAPHGDAREHARTADANGGCRGAPNRPSTIACRSSRPGPAPRPGLRFCGACVRVCVCACVRVCV